MSNANKEHGGVGAETETETGDSTVQYCPNCGEELPADTRFCQHCGTAVDGDPGGRLEGGPESANRRTSAYAAPEPVGNTDVVGRRIVAVLIDHVVAAIGVGILAVMLGLFVAALVGSDAVYTGVFVLVFVPGLYLYFALFEANGGQTPGKKALGIKVVKADGSAVTLREALVRNLVRVVDAFFNYLVGFVVILASSENRRLGDHVASTLVIRDE